MAKSSKFLKEKILLLFNKCLVEHRVPSVWKHSVISMLLKKDQNGSQADSYRPISSTPCLARLFERLVLTRLNNHLKNNNIIIMNQSGFRKARQTKDNVFTLIQTAQHKFNEKEKSLCIFFDIAGAFDKVWHKGLLFKLHTIRIPYYLIKIIGAFLKNRTFCVKIEGVCSSFREIECGVPQEGVLSPSLFSIYINDVPLAEMENELSLLFADDIVYTLKFKYNKNGKNSKESLSIAEKTVQEYLTRLEKWMNLWRLTLAPSKCAQITFTRAQKIEGDNFNLKLYGILIPYDVSPKFLGIVFDPRLSFEAHFKYLEEKLEDRLRILKILSYDPNWKLNTHLLINIYKTLVRSTIDYASIISGAKNQKLIDKLETKQNTAIRIIFKKSLLDHVKVEDLRERALVSSIKERHEELLSSYLEKCLTSGNPLIKKVFENYKIFKRRNLIRESLAIKSTGKLDLEKLNLIRATNKKYLDEEIYLTSLCKAKKIIKDLIIDIGEITPIGTGLR